MKKEWDIVDVLKHTRHDWLNKIQLIKGNLALDRVDRIKEIIDEIVMETQNETRLTNLQMPCFTAFLLTFNWEARHFRLDFEVIGEIVNLSEYDKELTSFCLEFFHVLAQAIENNGEHHLSLTIECQQENRFFFDFSGTIVGKEALIAWFEKKKRGDQVTLVDYSIHNEEMTAIIQVS